MRTLTFSRYLGRYNLVIVSKAVAVRTLILDLTMALTVGFALGYGVREWISRRRRQAERRRQGLGGGFWR